MTMTEEDTTVDVEVREMSSLELFLDGDEAPEFLRTTDQVDAYLAGLDAGDDDGEVLVNGAVHPVWQITDNGAAEWAMRRLKMHAEEVAQIERDAAEAIDKIKRWKERATASPQRRVEWLQNRLIAYAAYRIAEQRANGVKKPDLTLYLPSGEVSSRAAQAKFLITDEDLFIKSALEHDLEHLVRRADPQPAYMKDIKALLKVSEREVAPGATETVIADAATGYPIEGIIWDPGGDEARTFTPKPYLDGVP